MATLDLSGVVSPDTFEAASRTLYELLDLNGGIVQSGQIPSSGTVPITADWTNFDPTSQQFTVIAGVPKDGAQTLAPADVTQTIQLGANTEVERLVIDKVISFKQRENSNVVDITFHVSPQMVTLQDGKYLSKRDEAAGYPHYQTWVRQNFQQAGTYTLPSGLTADQLVKSIIEPSFPM